MGFVFEIPVGITLEVPKVDDPVSCLDSGYIWLESLVTVDVPPFKGCFLASFTQFDIAYFYKELKSCYKSLSGTADFSPVENTINLHFEVNGTGHFEGSGIIQPDGENGEPKLSFKYAPDQSYFLPLLNSLEEFCEHYSSVIKER